MKRLFFILLLFTGCSIQKEMPEKKDSCCKKTVTLNTDDIYHYDLQTDTWWKPLYKVKND